MDYCKEIDSVIIPAATALRDWLIVRNMNATMLAKKLPVDTLTVQRWLSGQRPQFGNRMALFRATGIVWDPADFAASPLADLNPTTPANPYPTTSVEGACSPREGAIVLSRRLRLERVQAAVTELPQDLSEDMQFAVEFFRHELAAEVDKDAA